ncbi:MAG: response regulator, partial [Alphaproteobacteria bacterium]|nr:response regulator [Alphaproteobacteria bacterium]
EALAMMRGEAGHEKLPQPCIVLMDINMPRMNGFQLLVEMRKSEELRQNIVFMLTTSAREEDKKRAYELNIAGYVLKENLAAFAEMLRNYFLVNEFP